MWAIILAGAIGFLTKIAPDIRAEHQAKKPLAAAISGELGAYLRLVRPEQTLPAIRALATIP